MTLYGVLWGPTIALLSRVYGSAGIAQVLGLALMQTVIGIGAAVGSAAGGKVAQIAGDAVAHALLAAICLATAFLTVPLLRPSNRVAELRGRG